MDNSVDFLESLPSDSLTLTLNNEPFIQRQHSDYWSIDGSIYKDYDIFICTGGKAQFNQGENSVILDKGKAFIAKPGVPLYANHIGEEYFTAIAQHFYLKIFGELDFLSLINFNQIQAFSDWNYITNILERYKKLITANSKKLEQHSLFYTIIMEFIYDSFQSEKEIDNNNYSFIFLMLNYIQKHYTDKDVLEKALKLSPYSHDYTSRVFRKRIGSPPKQYILESRLTLGRNLLMQELSIKDIAYRCGFNDELYFSRLFKKHIDISPTEFRKQYLNY